MKPAPRGARQGALAPQVRPQSRSRIKRSARRAFPFLPARWAIWLAKTRIPGGLGSLLTLFFLFVTCFYALEVSGQKQALIKTYGHPLDAVANLAGFRLQSVDISGLQRLSREDVWMASGIAETASTVFLDPDDVRDKLLAQPMIETVSVRKLLPHTLQISLTERQPFALWQKEGQVHIIARDGTVIDEVREARFQDLPFLVGDGAQLRAGEAVELLSHYPALRPHIRATVLVAQRRWNIVTKSGVLVRLPESNPAQGLAALAQLHESGRILDKDVLSIDLRLPDRAVVRLSSQAAAERQEVTAKIMKKGRT